MVSVIVVRIVGWTFTTEKYCRIDGTHRTHSTTAILVDAFELSLNTRGIGWNWGKINHASSSSFHVWRSLLRVVGQIILFDLVHAASTYLLPPHSSGSIYDASLAVVPRYVLASVISFFLGCMIYFFIDTSYTILALAAVLFLQNDPSYWPPVFNSPWSSTSLADFWGRRWHQVFRHIFLTAAGRPLGRLFGQAGLVMGSFLASGIVHAAGVWGMGRGGDHDFIHVCGFFLMMGVGIMCERWHLFLTGNEVGGRIGKLWTMVWIVGWSTMMFDVWVHNGMMDSVFLPSFLRASTLITRSLH